MYYSSFLVSICFSKLELLGMVLKLYVMYRKAAFGNFFNILGFSAHQRSGFTKLFIIVTKGYINMLPLSSIKFSFFLFISSSYVTANAGNCILAKGN